MIAKNTRENEMIILCKGCCEFLNRNFSLSPDSFFGVVKKCFILHKDFKQEVSKDKKKQFLSVKFVDLLSKDERKKSILSI